MIPKLELSYKLMRYKVQGETIRRRIKPNRRKKKLLCYLAFSLFVMKKIQNSFIADAENGHRLL
jgi:hypothetical protein